MPRQLYQPNYLGYISNWQGSGSFSMNSATTWLAYPVFPRRGGTLNAIRFPVGAITGTLAATDITCEVQTDNAGAPSGTNVTGGTAQPLTAVPTANVFNAVSGFTCALSANTPYWLVFKNVNAAPTTNYLAHAYNSIMLPPALTYASVYQSAWYTTTTGAAPWTRNSSVPSQVRLDWSDGTFDGFPIKGQNNVGNVLANGTNEYGAQFTLPGPSNLQYKVAGLYMGVNKTGTPAGFVQFNLYTGASPSLFASTQPCGTTNLDTGHNGAEALELYFLSGGGATQNTQTLTGGTVVTLTIASTAAETSGNGYCLVNPTVFDTDANSLALAPFQGTFQWAKLVSGAWTYVAGTLPTAGLILDSTGELSATGGGGGGMRVNLGLRGGMAA